MFTGLFVNESLVTTYRLIRNRNVNTFIVLEQPLQSSLEQSVVLVQNIVEPIDPHEPGAEVIKLAEDRVLAARQFRLPLVLDGVRLPLLR